MAAKATTSSDPKTRDFVLDRARSRERSDQACAGTFVVALDGPAGAGKSTVALRVAERLGFVLLDTGALYRALGHAALRAGLPLDSEQEVGGLAEELLRERSLSIEAVPPASMRVMLFGSALGAELRTPEISKAASIVSALPRVRAALLDVQRDYVTKGGAQGVVCEGRDIGTVVFPEAPLKLFVTASPEARAQRRQRELETQASLGPGSLAIGSLGTSPSIGSVPPPSFEVTLAEVMRRDQLDATRAIAPLKQAIDAVYIDTTDLELSQVIDLIVDMVHERRRS